MLDLIRQFFSSAGEVVKVYTLVDFYNYIKAVEFAGRRYSHIIDPFNPSEPGT